jgi:hypothetical protein
VRKDRGHGRIEHSATALIKARLAVCSSVDLEAMKRRMEIMQAVLDEALAPQERLL